MNEVIVETPNYWQMNMPKGVTPLSHWMYDLHMIAMVVCAIIGVIVFGVMIYAIIYHRKSKGFVPATFYNNNRLEIIWTIIPFIILIGLAIPATKVLMQLEDYNESDLTIKIVGYQWKWQYQYLDQGISYFSNISTPFAEIENQKPKSTWYLLDVDRPLVLPVNKKIRFLITSNDVIHSWWVPDLGIKRDAMPGFIHEAWANIEKPGIYRGQCAELCGINHAYMPIVVHAVKEEEFEKWVHGQEKTKDQYTPPSSIAIQEKLMTYEELMSLGKQKYEQICAACHRPDGTGLPPLYPSLKGSSIAIGHPVARHISIILGGVPGSAMQGYQDQLTDSEIAAIVTYERNAWENNTGDVVQATDVAKVKRANIKSPKIIKKAASGRIE